MTNCLQNIYCAHGKVSKALNAGKTWDSCKTGTTWKLQIKRESTLIMLATWQVFCWIMSCLSQTCLRDKIFTTFHTFSTCTLLLFFCVVRKALDLIHFVNSMGIISKTVRYLWHILVWQKCTQMHVVSLAWSFIISSFSQYVLTTHNFVQLLQK